MLATAKLTWQEHFARALAHTLNDILRKDILPDRLTLPLSRNQGLFEYGGTENFTGFAVIPATPQGTPSWPLLVCSQPKVNGTHALVKIWPKCLVAIGAHHAGREHVAIYRVEEVHPPVRDKEGFFPELGEVQLSFFYSDDHSRPNQPGAKMAKCAQLLQALRNKLYTPRCRRPQYVQLLNMLGRHAAYTFVDEMRETDQHNGFDLSAELEHNFLSFAGLYDELIQTCAEYRCRNQHVRVVAECLVVHDPYADLSGKTRVEVLNISYRIYTRTNDQAEEWELVARLPNLLYNEEVRQEIIDHWGAETSQRLLPRYDDPDELKQRLKRGEVIVAAYDYIGR